MTDKESAIYSTGYWNGIAYKRQRELSDEEILALWVKKNNLNGAKDILDFARAIMERCRIINGTDK